MAVSTLIIIVISVLVLIGLAYMLTDGFAKFKRTTSPLLQSSEGIAVKKSCEIACSAKDGRTFCCQNFSISEESVKCTDSRLELDCSFGCDVYVC